MNDETPITLDIVCKRLEEGFNVLPIADGSKRPCLLSWKRWQLERQGKEFLATAFLQARQAYAIITGAISGNLVCIDFDCGGAAYAPFMAKIPEAIRARLLVESSRSGTGRHVYVRLSHAPKGSEVFARSADGHPLIETRAQGGYIIAAPSVGQTILQGSFDAVPVLSDADYDLMVLAARSLDETRPPIPDSPANQQANQPVNPTGNQQATRPGDLFNQGGMAYFTGAIQTLGWQRVGGTETAQQWRRPDKTSGSCSATLRRMDDGVWSWYTFSTSTNLPPNRGLNIFSAFAKLFYNDDFAAAARHLAAEGFCDAPQPPVTIVTDQPPAAGQTADAPSSLLSRIPRTGLIGRIADYTDAVSPRQNPTLSLAGAFAFVAHAAGMAHYRSQYGDRPNLYLATLAPSAIGKSFPLTTNRRIAHALGIDSSVIGQIASGPGLEDAAARSPRALLVHLDEFQKLLGQMNAHDSGSALAQALVSTLLQLYGASRDVYAMRKMSQRGQRQKNLPPEFLDEPHVTVAAFGIAQFVFEHLSVESLADGLLGRFIVFIEEKRGPRVEEPIEEPVPEDIVSAAYYLCHRHETFSPVGAFPTRPDVLRDKPIVRFCEDAAARRKELQREEDRLYDAVPDGSDGEGRRAIIGRTFEKAMKLALVLAVSDNPTKPSISLANVENGWAIARASTDTLLALAENYTARNRYDELNKRIKRICREYGKQGRVSRTAIVRHMHEAAKDIDEVLITMQEAGEISVATVPTGGRSASVITLLSGAA